MTAVSLPLSWFTNPKSDLEFNSRFRIYRSDVVDASKRPVIVALPGGPALSSATIEPLRSLRTIADVYLLDPAGTGDTNRLQNCSYESLLTDIEQSILAIQRPIILVGHSFGGIQLADLVIRKKVPVVGAVAIASFFSERALTNIEAILAQLITNKPEILPCLEGILGNPENPEHLQNYWALAQHLYFSKNAIAAGVVQNIQNDKSCQHLYAAWDGGIQRVKDGLLSQLKAAKVPLLNIAARNDGVVPHADIVKDAIAGDFEVSVIENSGHFVMIEQPKAVHDAIAAFLASEMGLMAEK